jgi:hypothetical protein
MADLLECLIQIKALRDTLEWIESLSGEAPAAADDHGVWTRMADAEHRYTEALGPVTGKRASPGHESGDARRACAGLRRANLARLGRCTASELAAEVEWPGRRSTTVADLVAIMLAHDTDVLGELRQRRAAAHAATGRAPTGAGFPS